MGHFKTCHWSVQGKVEFIDIAPSMTFSDAIKFFIWDKNLRKNLNKRYCHIVSLNFFYETGDILFDFALEVLNLKQ